jgi:hypothetical protein
MTRGRATPRFVWFDPYYLVATTPHEGRHSRSVTTAPVVYNAQAEIRQLIIDWVTSHGVIDPPTFATMDWKLVSNGQPVQITVAPLP